MIKLKSLFTFGLFVLALYSCSENKKSELQFKNLNKQYLLTNEIQFSDRAPVFGGSSYLVDIDGIIYLCTARHLTEQPGGFDPKIDLNTYSDSVKYWKAFPRNTTSNLATVETKDIFYSKQEYVDMILFSVDKKPRNVGVLKPEFKLMEKGDSVRIVGCEYRNIDCKQGSYFAIVEEHNERGEFRLKMKAEKDFELGGFSGAPILDRKDRVIGHLVAASEPNKDSITIYAIPISSVRKIIP